MKCVICGRKFSGYGNNAGPVAKGECCDDCNLKVVVPARIGMIYADRERSKKNVTRKNTSRTRR